MSFVLFIYFLFLFYLNYFHFRYWISVQIWTPRRLPWVLEMSSRGTTEELSFSLWVGLSVDFECWFWMFNFNFNIVLIFILYLFFCSDSRKIEHRTQETTFVHQTFGGYTRSRITCLSCKNNSDTYEPFLDLQLSATSSIISALEKYTKPERLEKDNAYKCEKWVVFIDIFYPYKLSKKPN